MLRVLKFWGIHFAYFAVRIAVSKRIAQLLLDFLADCVVRGPQPQLNLVCGLGSPGLVDYSAPTDLVAFVDRLADQSQH